MRFFPKTKGVVRKLTIARRTFIGSSLASSSRLLNRPHMPFQKRTFAEQVIPVPSMGDSITEGMLSEWAKQEGEWCEVDDVVCVVETDKVSVDIRAPVAGVLKKQLFSVDDTLEVGADIMIIDPDAPRPEGAAPSTPAAKPAAAAAEPATPAAAKPAGGAPPPSSPPPAAPKPAATPAAVSPPKPAVGSRGENRVPMSRMRQRIAERLKESQDTNAALTTFNEIDCSNMMALRKKYGDEFLKKHGCKLGFMSMFVRASVAALQDQPAVNASIEGKDIVYKDYCDISVAVAAPKGLVTPVIRNAEAMSCADVEKTIGMYGAKAKAGTIALEDLTGGTFTISNGGVFKSLMGTPIINLPQSAILGMHGIFDRPVAVNGKVEIRPMMYVALTYDHRIIDGREAVLFLRKIKDCVEDPVRLVLDL